ncbi:MAG: hypothetical protein JNM99_16725 [Verrucomicrobiaceae bacterium]|nr:hypothetical protein [Verrucomicrobiaceae bacterium]
MSESPPNVGRVIRTALIVLPFGTILLGALSFVFYFNKQEKVLQRSIKYAAGLRKDLNEADLKHYESIVTEASSKPGDERTKSLAAFVESTLGPENMGYEVRTLADPANPQSAALALDVELTGTKRPNDVVLVLCDYLGADTARATACLLGCAHSLTGTPLIRSIRFTAVQNVSALKHYQTFAVSPQDRFTHVVLLGNAASATDAEITGPLHLQQRGTVILRPELKGDLLTAAQALLKQLNDLADRL